MAEQPVAGILVIGLTVAWSAVPLGVVVLLAGLEGIPREIYEQSRRRRRRPGEAVRLHHAAAAAPRARDRPAERRSALDRLFDQVYVLVGLDPQKITVAGSMYLYAFRDFNFGFGFAASVIATAITAAISLVYLGLVYREEEY